MCKLTGQWTGAEDAVDEVDFRSVLGASHGFHEMQQDLSTCETAQARSMLDHVYINQHLSEQFALRSLGQSSIVVSLALRFIGSRAYQLIDRSASAGEHQASSQDHTGHCPQPLRTKRIGAAVLSWNTSNC